MENLSALNTKCLANMPMLLESVCQTITKLGEILFPYFNSLEKELKSAGYTISDKWERGTIYALGHQEKHKTQWLAIYSIYPEIKLNYTLPFEKTVGKNLFKFELLFGYICDESQNVIYFQISEISETLLVKNLLESCSFIKSKSVSQEFQYGNFEEKKDIWVQFTVDENLSTEKIDDLYNVFKENILLPTLNEIQKAI